MNYTDETMKAKYAHTAFAFLFEDRSVPKPLTKAERDRERGRLQSARANAVRAAKNKAMADNKLKANWTI